MRSKKEYNSILSRVCKKMGHCETTISTELDTTGKNLFGANWMGVYPSDKTEFLKDMKNGNVAILNLDTSRQAGSHWISIAKKNNQMIIYDSFGRKLSKIAPNIYKSLDDLKKEGYIINKKETPCGPKFKYPCEGNKETNCGQRALAFLVMLKRDI